VPFNVDAALSLTDGTIMVEDWDAALWWVLYPDAKGNYANGVFIPTGAIPLNHVPTICGPTANREGLGGGAGRIRTGDAVC
jgi:hypothetical protein